MSTDSNTNVPADEQAPASSGYAARPGEIDSMVADSARHTGFRINTATGTAEALSTGLNQRSDDTREYTSASMPELVAQIEQHRTRAADIRQKLDAQVHDVNTGRPTGPKVTGRDREVLEGQLALCAQQEEYTGALMVNLYTALEQAVAARVAGQPTAPTKDDLMREQATRADAIAQIAAQQVNGRALGHAAAAELYDKARAQALAEKLARGG